MLDKIAVIDIETTGVDTLKCSIVSAGIVLYNKEIKEYYFECAPFKGAFIDEESLKVNGYTKKELSDKNRMPLKKLLKSVINVLEENNINMIAGHNPSFDRDFLRNSCKKFNIEWNFGHRTLDLHSVCYSLMLNKGFKIPVNQNGMSGLTSDAIYKFLGMPEEPKPHIALNGAKMEFEAFSRLIYKKSALKEFSKIPIKKI
jgi:DNA polymerase III epsilon subunit-like protein